MAYTFVRATGSGTPATTTTSPATTSFASNTLGNLIVLCCMITTGASNPISSVMDGAGNTYGSPVATLNAGSSSGGFHAYYVINGCNASAGTNTITVNWTPASNRMNFVALEYSGQPPGSLLDHTVVSPGNSNSPLSVSLSATNANELMLAMGGHGTGGGNWSASSGTFRSNVTNQQLVVMDQTSVSGSNTVGLSFASNGIGMSAISLLVAASNNSFLLLDVGT
jgi:hypothetical protein